MTDPTTRPARDNVAPTRAALGAVGCHLPTVGAMRPFPTAVNIDAAQRLERSGYRSVWSGEGIGGKDVFVETALMLAATDQLAFGTGVANMWARPAETAHGACSVLAEAFPDRFVLGLGAGYPFHAEAVGSSYGRPLSLLREYVRRMTADAPGVPVPELAYARVLAANGPKMLAMAGEETDGAHPTVVPPEYTARARAALGPDKLLIVGVAVAPDVDEIRARETARELARATIGQPGSPYGNNLIELGYPAEEVAASSDRVLDAVIPHGGRDVIAAKIREHLDAGADHVVVTPMASDYGVGLEQLEWLAPALTRLN